MQGNTAKKRALATLATLVLTAGVSSAAPKDVGLVLMHGKWSNPGATMGMVAHAAERDGHMVENIEMPWSGRRDYDKDYTEAMAEIDAAVTRLKAKGAGKIVIGGHSFGANAALAYGSSREGVAGVMLLAPGHSPDRQQGFFAASVEKARAMIADGKGDQMAKFEDSNQGRTKTIDMRARIYLSYFDPTGLGAMSVTAPKIKPGTAMFLAIGDKDPWFRMARSVIFSKAPADPRSRYVELASNHFDTPKDALPDVLAWLKTFQ